MNSPGCNPGKLCCEFNTTLKGLNMNILGPHHAKFNPFRVAPSSIHKTRIASGSIQVQPFQGCAKVLFLPLLASSPTNSLNFTTYFLHVPYLPKSVRSVSHSCRGGQSKGLPKFLPISLGYLAKARKRKAFKIKTLRLCSFARHLCWGISGVPCSPVRNRRLPNCFSAHPSSIFGQANCCKNFLKNCIPTLCKVGTQVGLLSSCGNNTPAAPDGHAVHQHQTRLPQPPEQPHF